MRRPFPLLEILGGVLGIGATAALTWPRFTPDKPPVLYSEQLAGNIIFTAILLVPFVAAIVSAFMLPVPSRWPMLKCSSILSLVWLTASSVANNFPHAPLPTTAPTLLSLSTILFFPSVVVLIIATVLSLRKRKMTSLSQQRTMNISAVSIFAAIVLSASLYVLFLHQGGELWSRVLPGGQWVKSSDVMHLPPDTGSGAITQGVNDGVVRPAMALISAGLLALGVFSLGVLFRISRKWTLSA